MTLSVLLRPRRIIVERDLMAALKTSLDQAIAEQTAKAQACECDDVTACVRPRAGAPCPRKTPTQQSEQEE